ncbi:MAG: multiheme c-type cytochrome [Kiloniellales bacterium]|nr:multiheme c-type cytochrome [Kiloniellales bacterium]
MTSTRRLALIAGLLLGPLSPLSPLSPMTGAFAQTSQEAATPGYLTSEACAACHDDVTARWRGSHHAWAWRLPTDETVLGDFDDARVDLDGGAATFARRDGSFRLTAEGPDGEPREFEIVGTVGVAPLQQYLVETEPGRLQAPDVAWDDVERRWYDLYPDLDLAHGDGLHWTGPYKNWNSRCAECHATGFAKQYAPLARSYASEQAEIGVGCEACHGPGEAHAAWARDPASFDGAAWAGVDVLGLTHGFPAGAPEAEIQQCAGCHARREPLGDGNPPPGTAFADAYRLALMRPGLYHPDGQILDEVYVYGSFLQSRMYARGVRCSNCHEPHSGELRAEGNAVCAQCHSPAGNPDFPSLALKDYDTPAHHFHEPGSEGAQCKSCHMIERVYMQVDGRRDHSFRVPRPDLSLALGTPNACTDCHADRDAEWAAAEVAAWYPDSARRGDHFARAFAAAWQGDGGPETVASLVEIASDESRSAFVRASALEALRAFAPGDIAERTAPLLSDDAPLVRAAAVALQRPAPPALRLRRVAPLLRDPMKSVRIEAARSLLDLLAGGETPAGAAAAMREYQQALIAKADFPETQMAIAGTALTFRNFAAAESAFAEAARMDPQLVEAWQMIARLRAAGGDLAGAAEAIDRGLAANPGDGPLLQLQTQLEEALRPE